MRPSTGVGCAAVVGVGRLGRGAGRGAWRAFLLVGCWVGCPVGYVWGPWGVQLLSGRYGIVWGGDTARWGAGAQVRKKVVNSVKKSTSKIKLNPKL